MPTDQGSTPTTYQHQPALAPRPSRRDRRSKGAERTTAHPLPQPPAVPARSYAFRRH